MLRNAGRSADGLLAYAFPLASRACCIFCCWRPDRHPFSVLLALRVPSVCSEHPLVAGFQSAKIWQTVICATWWLIFPGLARWRVWILVGSLLSRVSLVPDMDLAFCTSLPTIAGRCFLGEKLRCRSGLYSSLQKIKSSKSFEAAELPTEPKTAPASMTSEAESG